jgi:hypothetical protein
LDELQLSPHPVSSLLPCSGDADTSKPVSSQIHQGWLRDQTHAVTDGAEAEEQLNTHRLLSFDREGQPDEAD